ncbi:MAG: hypothetical protein K940chlam2_01015 [Chlamydiae bacterium]|nr:hypothetical protein [Chlamydiota bacterium]
MEALETDIPIGAIYRHYKGKEYKVLTVGRHSEDLTPYVVYQGLYYCESFGNYPIWVRPLELFLSSVVIDGQEVARFTLTHPPSSANE